MNQGQMSLPIPCPLCCPITIHKGEVFFRNVGRSPKRPGDSLASHCSSILRVSTYTLSRTELRGTGHHCHREHWQRPRVTGPKTDPCTGVLGGVSPFPFLSITKSGLLTLNKQKGQVTSDGQLPVKMVFLTMDHCCVDYEEIVERSPWFYLSIWVQTKKDSFLFS